jgi:uncharacterized surface protein with fasciclin (FAS1) repeats
MRTQTILRGAVAGTLLLAALAVRPADAQEKNIPEIAIEAGSFNTLVAALQAADLVEALSGPGPFTVFAPTDEAFAKIPAEKLQAILADKELLTSILTYHVASGKLMASDVVGMESIETLNGESLTVSTAHGAMVGNANIVATDVVASNGVVHVIDTVLVP